MPKAILFKEEDGVVRGEGTAYQIANFLTREHSSKLSVAVSRLQGRLWKTMNKESDRAYYFLEGGAKFTFEGYTLQAQKGEIVYVPAGTPYEMEGEFKAVLINAPPFDIKNEVAFE